MRFLLLTCAGAALILAGTAVAQTPERSGFLSVSGRGEPTWSIECAYQQGTGRTRTARVRGSRAAAYIAKTHVSSATCTYIASEDGPFEIRFNTEDFDCPLEQNDRGECVRRVAAGQTGQFTATARQ